MPDWTASMQQTFEYYIVDPGTWEDTKLIENVISSSIDWDFTAKTLGSAVINVSETVGEVYIRIYLITNQNGVKEKHPLGTFLVQTPSYSFDGKSKDISMDAYTPLLELNEKYPDIGFYVPEKSTIMEQAYILAKNNMRAPVVKPSSTKELHSNFVAETDSTWLTFLQELVAYDKYQFSLDEMGRIIFMPKQDTDALQPIWTYDDGNSSILYPDIDLEQDLYGIPNVVEVIYSVNNVIYKSTAENNDVDSQVSIQSRGRRIVHRDTDPSVTIVGSETEIQAQLDEYATALLKELSSLEYTISYTHAYCPVRIGDCVRLNYEKAGLTNIKARVISQSIECKPGCPVVEKAVFTNKLWR